MSPAARKRIGDAARKRWGCSGRAEGEAREVSLLGPRLIKFSKWLVRTVALIVTFRELGPLASRKVLPTVLVSGIQRSGLRLPQGSEPDCQKMPRRDDHAFILS